MISLKAGIAISIAALIVFGGVAFFTLNASTPSLSLKSVGYFSIDNNTSKEYFVSNTTSTLSLNFTVYSSVLPMDMYVYDISPINNTSANWVNITSLNGSQNYDHVTISSNGTLVELNLTLNQTAISQMRISNPVSGQFYPYVVQIIVISGNDNAAGFGFALFRI
ncbi:MAG: hypothetical protein M1327_03205 [Candidatus Thermoplasmatota archaeon]|nr:hypothetical protein [Candidatus Thermoplasmatota archaeon]